MLKTKEIPQARAKLVAVMDYPRVADAIGFSEFTLRRVFSSAFTDYWPSVKLAKAVAAYFDISEADVYEFCSDKLGKRPASDDGGE